MAKSEYIRVGLTIARDPATGDFLPLVPLYIKAGDCERAAEANLVEDLGKLFDDRLRRYMAECKAEELSDFDIQEQQFAARTKP